MVHLNVSLIKELREKTGAGMQDCKKALLENANNVAEAINWLRKKGLVAALKKAGRIASEGVVAVKINSNVGVMLEVNTETDFVAKNENFRTFVTKLLDIATSVNSLEELKKSCYVANFTNNTVEEELTNLIAIIGENITIRRFYKIDTNEGILSSYIHTIIAPNMGRIGVIVHLKSSNINALENLGEKIAMHIAACTPKALSKETLDPVMIEKEEALQRTVTKQSGKSDNIIEKMLAGKMNKFYQDVCLLEQNFAIEDTDKTISTVLKENNAELLNYNYYILGDGIEKPKEDFAEEVANIVKNI